MKEGWEIKKLGDICETSSGGTPSKSHPEYYEGGNIPWLRSGEISQGHIYETELYITEEGLKKSSAKIFPIDTVVIAMYGATVGQVGILKKEMSTNQAVCGIFPTSMLSPLFLVYYLKAKKPYFLSLAAGGAQPNISQNIIKSTPIPVPTIAEQEKIVAELDCLSGIIEKKKQQLKEYDALAQSIFYEMFGDPVENEKGWETCRVIDVVKMQRGYDLPVQQRNFDGKYPIYGSNGIIGYHNESKMEYGIVTGRSGTIGGVYLSHTPFWPLNTTLFSVDTYGNNIVFLKYLLEIFDLKRFKEGAGVPTLNRNNFHNERIIKIDLNLQQEFASKIEAIEKQKALIKKSIEEVEVLFNSRMDEYFN